MPEPTLRSYEPRDRAALYAICLETGDGGADASTLYRDPTLLGEVYVGPYVDFEPEWARVIQQQDRVSGYLLCAPDTLAFEERCEREWWPALRARYPRHSFDEGSADQNMVEHFYNPHRSDPELATRFPAHLHIDLLPSTQGLGLGGGLMLDLFERLRAARIPGLHLGVSNSNTRAIGFYRHLGFVPQAVDGGATIMGVLL